MDNEKRKLRYLSDHGWKPHHYRAMNQTNIVWALQMSDGFTVLESTLTMLEISYLDYNGLVRHCHHIKKGMQSDLRRMEQRKLI